jgi:dTMP kinase
VLVVWNVVLLGSGAVNVAEIALAKESLDAGDFGFGLLVGASGLGLTLGSLAASGVLERYGIRRTYAGSMAVMALGFGLAALAPTVWLAGALVVVATTGNGIAIVCNVLLVQRGAPDRLRGRAFTLIISSNYALMGAGMALAGPFTNAYGARWTWVVAAMVFALGSAVALAMASRLDESETELVLDEPELVPERQRAAVQ